MNMQSHDSRQSTPSVILNPLRVLRVRPIACEASQSIEAPRVAFLQLPLLPFLLLFLSSRVVTCHNCMVFLCLFLFLIVASQRSVKIMGFTLPLPCCRATLRRAHLMIIFVFLYLLSRIDSTICLPTLSHMPELWHGSASCSASHSGFYAVSFSGFLLFLFFLGGCFRVSSFYDLA